jgi:hypothetical protein
MRFTNCASSKRGASYQESFLCAASDVIHEFEPVYFSFDIQPMNRMGDIESPPNVMTDL